MVHHNIYDLYYKMNPAGLLAIAIELALSAQAQSIINEIIGGEVAVVEP